MDLENAGAAGHDLTGEPTMSSETSEKVSQEEENEEGGRAQEALQKAVTEACEEHTQKQGLFFPASEHMDSNLTSICTSAFSEPDNETGVFPNHLPWSECIPKLEAMEVLGQEEISPAKKACPKPTSSLDKQEGSFINRKLTVEDIQLPSLHGLETASKSTYNISLQALRCPVTHRDCQDHGVNPSASSLVPLPASEIGAEQSTAGSLSVAGTTPQFYTEDAASHLLRRQDDEILSQDQPSLEGTVHQEGANPPHNLEGLSRGESTIVSDMCSSSPSVVAENSCKRPFQEFRNSEASTEFMERNDSGAKAAMRFLLSCPHTRADTDTQLGSEAFSFQFLPWSEDFPDRAQNENASQEISSPAGKAFHIQIRPPESQEESFLSTADSQNTPCSSSAGGAAGVVNVPMKGFKNTMNQKVDEESLGEKGISSPVSPPNAGPVDAHLESSLEHKVVCHFSRLAPKIVSTYPLPWNKYLSGREQREFLIRSRYPLRQKDFEYLRAPPESRKYNRRVWMQNIILVLGLTVRTSPRLLRSQSC